MICHLRATIAAALDKPASRPQDVRRVMGMESPDNRLWP
jgi:hypothetical protein